MDEEVLDAADHRGGALSVAFQWHDSQGSVNAAHRNCSSHSPLQVVGGGRRRNTPQPKAAHARRRPPVGDARGTMATGAGAHRLQPSATAPSDSFHVNRPHRRGPDAVVDAAAAAVLMPAAIKPYLRLSSDTLSAGGGGVDAMILFSTVGGGGCGGEKGQGGEGRHSGGGVKARIERGSGSV